MANGRPSKLTPELLEKAKGYLATCVDSPVFTDKGAMTYVNVNLPCKVGLALYLGVDKSTIDNWCKETDDPMNYYFEFFGIVDQIMKEQEKRLINNGLGGLYKEKTNAMLLSKHGYATEKTETDITSGGEKILNPVLPEIIAEADRLLKERKLKENGTGTNR